MLVRTWVRTMKSETKMFKIDNLLRDEYFVYIDLVVKVYFVT